MTVGCRAGPRRGSSLSARPLHDDGDVAQVDRAVAHGGLERVDLGHVRGSGSFSSNQLTTSCGVRRAEDSRRVELCSWRRPSGRPGWSRRKWVRDHLHAGRRGGDGEEDHGAGQDDEPGADRVRDLPPLSDTVDEAPANCQGHTGLLFAWGLSDSSRLPGPRRTADGESVAAPPLPGDHPLDHAVGDRCGRNVVVARPDEIVDGLQTSGRRVVA